MRNAIQTIESMSAEENKRSRLYIEGAMLVVYCFLITFNFLVSMRFFFSFRLATALQSGAKFLILNMYALDPSEGFKRPFTNK